MIRRVRWIASLSVVASLAWMVPARADDAQELLRRGVQLRKDHEDQEALAAFERANALVPSPTARGQIALAQQALGDWLAAETNLTAALASPDDPWIARNRAALDEARVAIEQHLAWLEVDVNVEGAEVILDGQAVQARKGRILAGRSVLEVRAAGYAPDLRAIDVRPGSTARVVVALVPLVAPAPAPSEPAPRAPEPAPVRHEPAAPLPEAPSRVGPIVVGAVGLAAIGVGAYFGIRTLNAKSDRDALPCTPQCGQGWYDADSDARTSSIVSNVAIGVGAAGVTTSVVWLLLQPRSSAAPRVAPVAYTDGAGVVYRGVF